MIGLANRVRMTIERSPVPLDPFSVTMNGLHQLLLLPRRFWPRKVFMSRRSVIRAQTKDTTDSLHAYDRKEGSGLRSRASIPKSVTRRGAPFSAAASRPTSAKSSVSNKGVGCGAPWVSGRVRTICEGSRPAICDVTRHSTTRSEPPGGSEA